MLYKTFIYITKTYSEDGDTLEYGSSIFQFEVKNISDLIDAQLRYFGLEIVKNLGNNKYQRSSYGWSDENSSGGSVTVSGLSFNAYTGNLTGNIFCF
ncbi:MAG: hypothetical protein J7604_16805 [Sporocytophaga sp.]|uniref:hypothetical protein n=1 Tax=Sporocytophaga sp. TaxID=2231183 RepID=UPI001AFE082C|nr:hypothetical protein [Sporocytophaga sp.]MBO9701870.1 hypothetical protein [Sporocytophaga sp.]